MRIELTWSAWKADVLPLNYIRTILERKTRFELATLALARRCSTSEPLPHMMIFIQKWKLVEGDGFEPSKAQLTDLQSAPFGHSGIPPQYWSWWSESNQQPADYKSAALPLSHTSTLHNLRLESWRPGTGSNRRPPAWQAGILTNWTTRPWNLVGVIGLEPMTLCL